MANSWNDQMNRSGNKINPQGNTPQSPQGRDRDDMDRDREKGNRDELDRDRTPDSSRGSGRGSNDLSEE